MGNPEVQPPTGVLGFQVQGAMVGRQGLFRPLAVGKRGAQLVPEGVVACGGGRERTKKKLSRRTQLFDKERIHVPVHPSFPPSRPVLPPYLGLDTKACLKAAVALS